ncbi:hypothetical protein HID58_023088 [Brassica napus]|uniref:Ethylene insensitive 3-like DNA-binding domain-containing protein n=1 Tax=Brassica napus TaxID=3708 RepID=A0ABQ8D132_BRANA|nr:hypothetical protein HID58_023088 [Brassica napus]
MEPLSPIQDDDDGEDEEDELDRVNEDISYDDLKKRMWKDRNLMCKLKQQKQDDHDLSYPSSSTSPPSSSPSSSAIVRRAEASRRKKMARSQDSVLKYMMKIMEVCKARGFVYGIVPEKGKPISDDEDVDEEDQEPARLVALDQEQMGNKRKGEFVEEGAMLSNVYTCQNSSCPSSDVSLGFVDKNLRTGHEMECLYGTQEPIYQSSVSSDGLVRPMTTSDDDYSASSKGKDTIDYLNQDGNWLDYLWSVIFNQSCSCTRITFPESTFVQTLHINLYCKDCTHRSVI